MTEPTVAPLASTPRRFFGSAVLVTLLLLAGQISTVLIYSAMAAIFGRSVVVDAYLAGTTLPQYCIAVVVSALTFVLVPLFANRNDARQVDSASLAGQLVVVIAGGLSLVAILGSVISGVSIALIVPGLPPDAHRLAVHVSWVAWPSVVAAGLVATFAAIENAERRFAFAAAVPVIGAVLSFALVLVLGPRFGAVGLAVATTSGLLVQLVLLGKRSLSRWRFPRDLDHPDLAAALLLLLPLILSGLFLRATPILDRYLVSGFPEGSISALTYAGNASRFLAFAVSSGASTVLFPDLAARHAIAGRRVFHRLISRALRLMWFVVVPAATISIALADPLIRVVFERGRFDADDTAVVTSLFQIYQTAFIFLCLGSVTGRAIYASRMTRRFAILAVSESILYFAYCVGLVHLLGMLGAAVSYLINCSGSLCWQLVLVKRGSGDHGFGPIRPYLLTVAAAAAAGIGAAAVGWNVSNPWLSLVLGGSLGILLYGLVANWIRSPEMRLLRSLFHRQLAGTRLPRSL